MALEEQAVVCLPRFSVAQRPQSSEPGGVRVCSVGGAWIAGASEAHAVYGNTAPSQGNASETRAVRETRQARAGFANPSGTTCWVAATLQSLFAVRSTAGIIRQHVKCAACAGLCVLCRLKQTQSASDRPEQRPNLQELWGSWLAGAGRNILAQDDAGEFLQLVLEHSPELRAAFAQETCHHDTYTPQCGTRDCLAREVDTSEVELLTGIHFPEEQPWEADLQVALGEDVTEAEFDTRHTCACEETYVAVRRTMRTLGPGSVLAVRIMRCKDRREVLKAPEAMQVKGRWYRLRASVCHIGDSFNAGRYVCHVPLEASEKWVSYNDGVVRARDRPESNASQCRLLFYEVLNAGPPAGLQVKKETPAGQLRVKLEPKKEEAASASHQPAKEEAQSCVPRLQACEKFVDLDAVGDVAPGSCAQPLKTKVLEASVGDVVADIEEPCQTWSIWSTCRWAAGKTC